VAVTAGATELAPDLPGLAGQDEGTVLVLRALGLGDALTAVPALRGVRRAWPGRRVLLAAPEEVGGWLRDLGLVDGVVPARGLAPLPWVEESAAVTGATPAGHVAVNLHGSGPESHRVLLGTAPEQVVAFASREAGVAGPGWDPDEHEVDRWCRLVTAAGGACSREDLRLDPPASRGRHVVVHPGAASGSRRWPADRFAAVARDLAAAGHDVVVTGGPDERDLGARVVADATASLAETAGTTETTETTGTVTDTAGTLDLPALADVVATARLVVCGDTGVAHLATAFGTPSVVLFGPTPPSAWGPSIDPERHVVLWHGGDAASARPGGQPDGYRGDPHAAAVDPALERVTVDEVVAAARALLAAAPEQA